MMYKTVTAKFKNVPQLYYYLVPLDTEITGGNPQVGDFIVTSATINDVNYNSNFYNGEAYGTAKFARIINVQDGILSTATRFYIHRISSQKLVESKSYHEKWMKEIVDSRLGVKHKSFTFNDFELIMKNLDKMKEVIYDRKILRNLLNHLLDDKVE